MLLHEKLRFLRQDIVPVDTRVREPQARPDDAFGGCILETSAGPCLLVERHFSLDHRHGRDPLDACLKVSAQTLALLAHATAVPGSGLERAIFLDVETTGLSGGSGTYAFLIGLGCFEQGSFVIRQLLMRDYAEEPALLEALQEQLAHARMVVTFNGKSFDAPLLETRYLMAGRPSPLADYLHLDLLHPARRVWRGRLENCRLSSLEAIFGHQRADDVPAWMIPSLYFAFVRGQTAPLAQVLEHNRADVLSLAALAAHLGSILDDPLAEGRHVEEVYGAGLLHENQGISSRACAAYARVWELAPNRPMGLSAGWRLAAIYKRTGRVEAALPIWEQLARHSSPLGVQACVELAKYFEHRARDPFTARRHTLRARELLELMQMLGIPAAALAEEEQALQHRLERLTRRAAMAVESASARAQG